MKIQNRAIIKKNKGQAMMEYILITTLIGIFCVAALKNYGYALKKQVQVIKKQINSLPR